MASVNKVILLGNCGRDPEIRYLPSGQAVANVSIATSSRRKDRNTGESVEDTQWHRVTFYDRLAEIVGEYVRKGQPVYVEGRLKYGKYTDQAGVEKARSTSLPPKCSCWANAKAWVALTTTAVPPVAPHRPHAPRPPPLKRRPNQPVVLTIWTTIFRSRLKRPATSGADVLKAKNLRGSGLHPHQYRPHVLLTGNNQAGDIADGFALQLERLINFGLVRVAMHHQHRFAQSPGLGQQGQPDAVAKAGGGRKVFHRLLPSNGSA